MDGGEAKVKVKVIQALQGGRTEGAARTGPSCALSPGRTKERAATRLVNSASASG